MNQVRILHVDDEPDIREVVRISLALDPDLTVRSCSSGAEALSVAGEWLPDLVLLDVMMPEMDGPTTLSRLYQDPRTSGLPVVFMTARAQTRELNYFKSLGATGVIPKPFDPIRLAGAVREFLHPPVAGLDALSDEFVERAKRDAAELARCRSGLGTDAESDATLARIKQVSHSLAGAGGIFGFSAISSDAAAVEEAVIAGLPHTEIKDAIDRLLTRIVATADGAPGAGSNGTAGARPLH